MIRKGNIGALVCAAALGVAGWMPAAGASQEMMRFHCAQDTTEINELLRKGYECGKTQGCALVSYYGHALLGRPYVAKTLEGETERLTIDIDELDCTTFIETLYALARTTLNGRYSWRDYAANLEDVRYRGGKMDGYASRLHYISEWAVDNKSRGNLVEVTPDLPGCRYEVKTLDFMTNHRDSYPALKDSATYARLREYEIGYRNHRIPYVPKSLLGSKDLKAMVEDGDFVALVTKTQGLDVSHMGVIVKDEAGDIYLLNASSLGMKVQVEELDMLKMLRSRKSIIGIRVFRMKQ